MHSINFDFGTQAVDHVLPAAVTTALWTTALGTAVSLPFIGHAALGTGGGFLGGLGAFAITAGAMVQLGTGMRDRALRASALSWANKKNREQMILNNGGPLAFSALPLTARIGAQIMTMINTLSDGKLAHKVRQAEKLVAEMGDNGKTYWVTSISNKGVTTPTPMKEEAFKKMKREIDCTDVPLQIFEKKDGLVIERITVRGELDSRALQGPAMRIMRPRTQDHSVSDLEADAGKPAEVLAEAWFGGRDFTPYWENSKLREIPDLIRKYMPRRCDPISPAELRMSGHDRYEQHQRGHPAGHASLPEKIRVNVALAEKVTFDLLETDAGPQVEVSVGMMDGSSTTCCVLSKEEADDWTEALHETGYAVEANNKITKQRETIQEENSTLSR